MSISSDAGLNDQPNIITFSDNSLLAALYGRHDQHLLKLEQVFGVKIFCRGNFVEVNGSANDKYAACKVLESLYQRLRNGQNIDLASNVTGYTIDTIKLSEYNAQNGIVDSNSLASVKGFSEKQLSALKDNEIITKDDFKTDKDKILAIKGFGEKTYAKLLLSIEDAEVDA